ncbi:hypothetical protein U4E84_18325, partial [Halorubrum sp. AD140]|uniref:hypothetical protein n=1 Tax=Halorubrum sp. AD140 TaxID=3050073 RepID=UPI002ACCC5EE
CGEELEYDTTDNARSEANSGLTESVEQTTDDDVETIGLNSDVIEVVAVLGSLSIGGLLGLWLLFNDEIMLAGTTFLVAVGWPFLLTRHGRYTARRGLGLSRSSRHNKPSETTKQYPECGWHNHRTNNNCVECDTGFPE